MIATAEKIYSPDFPDKEAAPGLLFEPVNILVVDDLPEKLLAYEAILGELGQNVVAVRSGAEALRLVLRQEFAVILLDVNMPDMDGFETATLIRQRKKSTHTPIIFLTAFTDEIRMAQGYASGAVDYLPTPVVPEILQAKVKVFIELSRMRRQAALQAEEHAMRKAAEEAARRLEFLVGASEVFARAQDQADIMQALITLPVPYLAEVSSVWNTDNDGQLKVFGTNIGGKIISDPAQDAGFFLENDIRQVLTSGRPRVIDNFVGNLLFSDEKHHGRISVMAIIVPFAVKDHVNAALVLISGNNDAKAAATLSLANDLTSRAGIALKNAILMEKIKEADRRKDEFLAMLAHELRNPLAPIRNAVNILKMSPDKAIRSQLEDTIDRQIEHMVHLVDDLMDVSRITQGKIDLRREPIKLQDAINHAIETSDPLIQHHRHRLAVALPDTPIWLDADFGRLSQIFSNLLNNAAKYTNDKGVIEISAREAGTSAVIRVRDNGIGIPENMLQRIFDIFSQVDSSLERSHGGLGIGLTLVKSLVEMHGGTISVASSGNNTGSEFTVTMPTLAAYEASPVAEAEYEQPKTGRMLRVLVVDDSEAAAKTMGMMIELSGHEIRIAHDGAAAIELARSYRPEVVLMDIGLPGMNGYEICKIMKDDPLHSNTIFIAQTGWGQDEHRKRSQEAGFEHHLVKPVDMYDLEKLLNECSKNLLAASIPAPDISKPLRATA